MKKELVGMLCCPACKGELVLAITKENKDGIFEGTFTCKKCQCTYSIEEGIPNLLPK